MAIERTYKRKILKQMNIQNGGSFHIKINGKKTSVCDSYQYFSRP